MTKHQRPDKFKVARSFDNAASSYDEVAVLQRQTADELLDRLGLINIRPRTIVDLGAGTGRNLALLQQRYPDAQLVAVDIAPAMLQQARQTVRRQQGLRRWLPGHKQPYYLTGDAEHLPLADNSVDLLFANLALQWCEPSTSFSEIQRVLKPEGLLMFTSLGPDTLQELRQAWAEVDDYPHVNLFYDMHDVGDAMVAAGLADTVLDVERYTLHYSTAMAMMRDLKTLGARNVNNGRRRGLTGKKTMQRVIDAYEPYRQQEQLPASYEVIFGHAWCGGEPQQQSHADGSVTIPVSSIRRS